MTDIAADIAAIARIDAVPKILDVIARVTGMRFVAVARVTEDRWIACQVRDEIAFGLKPGDELKVETTICHGVRGVRQAVIIENVAEDEQYRNHPTPAMYGFQSYVSIPIVLANGRFFGTLCAIDPRPAKLKSPETISTLHLFAELIATHFDATERQAETEAILLDERKTAELREQFIAVLGHDLRSPLTAIDAGTQMLLDMPLGEKATRIVSRMSNSVGRMSVMISNVLDFARGRLGGGLSLDLQPGNELGPVLSQVLAEARAGAPDRQIDMLIDAVPLVACDPGRLGQLLSNLLGNALTYGAKETPILVRATERDGCFVLSVSNAGDPIPETALERLFQPFQRGAAQNDNLGLGLGLYIAAEIARAHGGSLGVTSTSEATCFTFQMPADAIVR